MEEEGLWEGIVVGEEVEDGEKVVEEIVRRKEGEEVVEKVGEEKVTAEGEEEGEVQWRGIILLEEGIVDGDAVNLGDRFWDGRLVSSDGCRVGIRVNKCDGCIVGFVIDIGAFVGFIVWNNGRLDGSALGMWDGMIDGDGDGFES